MDTQVGSVTSLTAGEWGCRVGQQWDCGLSLWGHSSTLGHCSTDCPSAFTDSVTGTLPMQDPYPANSLPPWLPSAPFVLARPQHGPHPCSSNLQNSLLPRSTRHPTPPRTIGTRSSNARTQEEPRVAPSPSYPSLAMLSLECLLSPSTALTILTPQSYQSVVPKLHLTIQVLLRNLLGPHCPESGLLTPPPVPGPNCHRCRLQSSSGDRYGMVVGCVPRSSSPWAQPVSAGLTD